MQKAVSCSLCGRDTKRESGKKTDWREIEIKRERDIERHGERDT